MTLLSNVQQAVDQIQADEELNALRFRLSGTWSDGTTTRYSVRDPNKGNGGKGFQRLSTDPLPASLRLLGIWPGDPEPAPGAVIDYQGGKLVLGLWSDESIWTGQRTGVCRLVDERAYPLMAFSEQGWFRLRVSAQDAPALTSTSNDLTPSVNNSHWLDTPPGVRLEVGEVVTTTEGDVYTVAPPVQRDLLGDRVGGSWQRKGEAVTPPDPASPDGTPSPAPAPDANPDDSWWREGLP